MVRYTACVERFRVHFAPDVSDLASVGVAEAEDLFEPFPRGKGPASRAQPVGSEPGRERIRLPLPGTPDENGRVHERPQGAGTGWLWLVRYDGTGSWRELAGARLRRPRSTSLASRDWNLICHARRFGIATPEPFALIEDGRGPVARRSALLVRELEDWTRLDRWLQEPHDDRAWGRAARALGELVARLQRAQLQLPNLAPEHLWLSPDDGCGRRPNVDPALRVRHRPTIGVSHFEGGRLGPVDDEQQRTTAARIEAAIGGAFPTRARVLLCGHAGRGRTERSRVVTG